MTGLEKMKSQILDEAGKTASDKLAKANGEAEAMLSQAKEQAARDVENISRKSEADAARLKERVESSNDLLRRTKLLEAKQQMITEVLDKAYASVETMGEGEYFAMLLKMLGKYARPQEGQMYLSAGDFAKMPGDFEGKAKAVAKEKGGSLSVLGEGRNIENGFVLAYDGIEENCTLKAMFDAKKDDLSDKVHRILF